jgi:hypothetical protein
VPAPTGISRPSLPNQVFSTVREDGRLSALCTEIRVIILGSTWSRKPDHNVAERDSDIHSSTVEADGVRRSDQRPDQFVGNAPIGLKPRQRWSWGFYGDPNPPVRLTLVFASHNEDRGWQKREVKTQIGHSSTVIRIDLLLSNDSDEKFLWQLNWRLNSGRIVRETIWLQRNADIPEQILNLQIEHSTPPIMVNSQYNGWRMEDVWLDR